MIQRESPSKSRTSTARFRLVMAGIAAAFILPIAGLMSIPFLISEPLAVIRPAAAPTTLSEDAGNGALARIQMDRGGSFTLDLILSRVRDEMPRIEMRMPEHRIAAPPRTVRTIYPGSFRVEGQFAMPGRWQIGVDYAGSSQVLEFIVGEY
ncbi:MAG: hypothetical protein ACOZAM_09480 [Pseudomonadota bacterium]|jgi:hypothetical protein